MDAWDGLRGWSYVVYFALAALRRIAAARQALPSIRIMVTCTRPAKRRERQWNTRCTSLEKVFIKFALELTKGVSSPKEEKTVSDKLKESGDFLIKSVTDIL